MPSNPYARLSRRERQIMEVIYRLRQATVQQVRDNLGDPPSYSAVRAQLRILEEKGHLRHIQDGPRYVFVPTVARRRVRRAALRGLLRNFFDNSREEMIAALLEDSTDLSDDELKRLSRMIKQARKEGR
jgi:predicted transcriptional regulator